MNVFPAPLTRRIRSTLRRSPRSDVGSGRGMPTCCECRGTGLGEEPLERSCTFHDKDHTVGLIPAWWENVWRCLAAREEACAAPSRVPTHPVTSPGGHISSEEEVVVS